ncbi:zinc-dependent alcohol dehydrogenase [Cohnella zeiphila]|uniref:Zinc-binding dehydrogenase n=1 Tax=Cohnella zeiphila TaxID=2761120 RepID=A0A7X0SV94_9BACL|nr:zinc-binding dehydrogenase [Cohnella zeiphila]MBB6734508.1 zinc-binding dehydrogenase [Cohnella zeiphila]
MKALQIIGKNDYRIVDLEVPAIGDHEVLVEIRIVSTCPRWDLNMMGGRDMFRLDSEPAYPLPPGWPGHEMAGFVAAVGRGVKELRIGDRVAALNHIEGNGAYAQYLAYREEELIKLPDEISFEQAASFELLQCVVTGLLQFSDLKGKSILVSGLGPAGILAVQAAKLWGASRVVGIDMNEERLAFVREKGWCEAVHVKDLGDLRFDLGYDCVGDAASVQNVLDHTDDHVVIFGVLRGEVKYGAQLWFKGTRLESYRYQPLGKKERKLLLDLVVHKGLDTQVLQSVHGSFARYREAVDLLRNQQAIKVYFYPQTDFE